MDPEQTLPYTPGPIEHSTQIQVQQRQPSPSSLGFTDNGGRPQTQSSGTEKPLLGNDSSQGQSPARDHNDLYADFEPVPRAPRATRSRDGHMLRGLSRHTVVSGHAPANASDLGWIVPVEEEPRLQILLGALTTGLAASLSGRQVSIAITILGVMSTITASLLTRARGLNEPELSNTRVTNLEHFLRDCDAFQTDCGEEYGTTENGLNDRLERLRKEFEKILRDTDGQQNPPTPIQVRAGDQRSAKLPGNADGQQNLSLPIKAGDEIFEKFVGNADGQQKFSLPIKAAR
ncbi:hypothetical protein DFJ58DRAFT_731779 [Suillus subalutaceus]|uniref:uncharacterized protein n=1 Tax=Suillus subalutaceus TaxID=48586 RepID=UPI001B87273E|nr:uncharacterized protein DFJ58DRAFT_731779 [Suillus subalutaceus]KAG1843157.1 hypothetical protein DFJ58DRAFT_731779 [Suillus subalutaceus]